jgi:hypothetical protein
VTLHSFSEQATDFTEELPATAWPCRLRHVPDQKIPRLEFDDGPFKSGLISLRIARYGEKLRTYQPPSENIYDVMFEGEVEEPTAAEIQLKELHAQWIDLHAATKKNLLEFESPDFCLPSKATGYDNVKTLVSNCSPSRCLVESIPWLAFTA